MEERCLRVPYPVLGAGVGWLIAIAMMCVATVSGGEGLHEWALLVAGGSMVMSMWCILTSSRARLLEAIELQLRMHAAAQSPVDGVPRIPTPLR